VEAVAKAVVTHQMQRRAKEKRGQQQQENPQNAWKCESVISEGGNRQYKYIVEVESENKFNLLAKTNVGEEFVNIATVDPKHDNKVDIGNSLFICLQIIRGIC
jgi:hypothetical protein